MLLEPPVDKMIKKIGNPYKLTVLVGKRAKFLQTSLPKEEIEKESEVTKAINEVYTGKVV